MIELKDTVNAMLSKDYKERFIGEYYQNKIRLTKLQAILNKWEAWNDFCTTHVIDPIFPVKRIEDFIGFTPSCSYSLLKDQVMALEKLVHVLEVRAVIENINLNDEVYLFNAGLDNTPKK